MKYSALNSNLKIQILEIGTTELDEATRNELLADLSGRYQPKDYNLLKHNCNNFSNEFCQLLCGNTIPVSALQTPYSLVYQMHFHTVIVLTMSTCVNFGMMIQLLTHRTA
jgi:hypothetical protein